MTSHLIIVSKGVSVIERGQSRAETNYCLSFAFSLFVFQVWTLVMEIYRLGVNIAIENRRGQSRSKESSLHKSCVTMLSSSPPLGPAGPAAAFFPYRTDVMYLNWIGFTFSESCHILFADDSRATAVPFIELSRSDSSSMVEELLR